MQVTSPIRRYTDLLAHYQLKAALLGKTPPHSNATLLEECERSSDAARDYAKLESECKTHFMAYYFEAHRSAVFEGEYLGWVSKVRDHFESGIFTPLFLGNIVNRRGMKAVLTVQ